MDWDPTTHYQTERVAESYDRERFSSLAGRIFNALEKYNIRRAFAAVPRGAVLLDLPCGTGRLAEVLLEDGFTVVGVDISPDMLRVAQRKLQRFGGSFKTQVGDVRELARQERERYDAALCARVLMHFPLDEQITFLKGVALLVKGKVIITHSLSTPYQRLRRLAKRWLGYQPPVLYPVTGAELRRLLAGAGLVEVKRLRPFPLLTEEVIVIAEHGK
jgi:2-polyprenyl-3-methyl-5-hydroxy-6-metoxy-1,4-benzoquinol methylase